MRNRPVGTGSQFFAAIGVIGVIALMSLLGLGSLPEGVILALLLLLVVAAVFPPLIIGFGGVIIVYLAFRQGWAVKLFGWLGSIGGTKPLTPTTTDPLAALGPSVPTVVATGPNATGVTYG